MAVRVGINGFGRIGRSFTRAILARGEQAEVELVAVNDPFGDAHTMAFLLKHDSVGGTLRNEVKEDTGGFSIDGSLIYRGRGGNIDWASTFDINEMAVKNLSGIEYYRNESEVPASLAPPVATCGMIAFWTRRD